MMRRLAIILILGAVGAAGCVATTPREHVRFATLAGLYYDAEGDGRAEAALVEDTETLVGRAVQQINRERDVDFVVVAGDLFADTDPLSVDRLKSLLADLEVPYYVVLGDHDGPGGGGADAVSRSLLLWTFQGHGFDGTAPYWAREVASGVMLVGLDTARPGQATGHVDTMQLAWLDRTLSANRGKSVIVVAHHGLVPLHPLDEGSKWRELLVDNADEVRRILAKHPNVVLAVTGHHHFAGGKVEGRTLYLATPSVSVWPLAYSLIEVGPEEAEAVWVPISEGVLQRRAQDRLLASETFRGVFPRGEDGDTACVRLFGGNKLQTHKLPAIRQ